MGSFSFFLLLSLCLLAQGSHIRGDQGDPDTFLHQGDPDTFLHQGDPDTFLHQGDPDTFLDTSSETHFHTLLVPYLKINLGNLSGDSVNRTKR